MMKMTRDQRLVDKQHIPRIIKDQGLAHIALITKDQGLADNKNTLQTSKHQGRADNLNILRITKYQGRAGNLNSVKLQGPAKILNRSKIMKTNCLATLLLQTIKAEILIREAGKAVRNRNV